MDSEQKSCSYFKISLVGDANICKECGEPKSSHNNSKGPSVIKQGGSSVSDKRMMFENKKPSNVTNPASSSKPVENQKKREPKPQIKNDSEIVDQAKKEDEKAKGPNKVESVGMSLKDRIGSFEKPKETQTVLKESQEEPIKNDSGMKSSISDRKAMFEKKAEPTEKLAKQTTNKLPSGNQTINKMSSQEKDSNKEENKPSQKIEEGKSITGSENTTQIGRGSIKDKIDSFNKPEAQQSQNTSAVSNTTTSSIKDRISNFNKKPEADKTEASGTNEESKIKVTGSVKDRAALFNSNNSKPSVNNNTTERKPQTKVVEEKEKEPKKPAVMAETPKNESQTDKVEIVNPSNSSIKDRIKNFQSSNKPEPEKNPATTTKTPGKIHDKLANIQKKPENESKLDKQASLKNEIETLKKQNNYENDDAANLRGSVVEIKNILGEKNIQYGMAAPKKKTSIFEEAGDEVDSMYMENTQNQEDDSNQGFERKRTLNYNMTESSNIDMDQNDEGGHQASAMMQASKRKKEKKLFSDDEDEG